MLPFLSKKATNMDLGQSQEVTMVPSFAMIVSNSVCKAIELIILREMFSPLSLCKSHRNLHTHLSLSVSHLPTNIQPTNDLIQDVFDET